MCKLSCVMCNSTELAVLTLATQILVHEAEDKKRELGGRQVRQAQRWLPIGHAILLWRARTSILQQPATLLHGQVRLSPQFNL